MMAFLQTRGSVPVFWEQPGLQVGAHKVRLSRSHEATAPAFRRHIDRQFTLYSAVQIVNLLGAGASEKELSDAYVKHSQEWQSVDDSPLPLISFDFHAVSIPSALTYVWTGRKERGREMRKKKETNKQTK